MKSPEELKRLMDHPVLLAHDSTAKIVRAQLFFIAVSTLLLSSTSITIGEGSSILGIQLEGLTSKHIFTVASLLLAYQILHFLWASFESVYEWRARLTALDTGGWGGGGIRIADEDQKIKIRQTTLYAFFTSVLNSDLLNARELLEKIETPENSATIKDLAKPLERIADVLCNPRVEESLWRFDNWFKMFCKMQNYRWLILDFSIPIILGVSALICAINEIFQKC